MRKGEIACNKQFLLFSQCFLPYFGTYCSSEIQFKMSSAICLYLDQSKILSSGNGLKTLVCRGRESNPRPPAHEADALTTRPPRRSYSDRIAGTKYILRNYSCPMTRSVLTRHNSAFSVSTSNLVYINEVTIRTTFNYMVNIAGTIYLQLNN